MSQYNIAEAKAQLSELTRRALAGEEVIIARDNTPLVRLIPVQASSAPGSRVLERDNFSGWRPTAMPSRKGSRTTADAAPAGYPYPYRVIGRFWD